MKAATKSLKRRLVFGLLIVSLVPLAVSAVLINQISHVAQNFSDHRVKQLVPHLENAQRRYVDLVQAKKAQFRATIASWAEKQWLADAVKEGAWDSAASRIAAELSGDPDILRFSVLDATGKPLHSWASNADDGSVRPRALQRDLVGTDAVLSMVFSADPAIMSENGAIGVALETEAKIGKMGGALPRSYRNAFLVLVGGVVVLVTLVGLVLGTRITRRLDAMVAVTHRIAEGDAAAKMAVSGRDELTELSVAFNNMVRELEAAREKAMYMQRIGAWQEVARRLAHEIKNPLTPIQLAVQQVVSSYKGEDERHRRTLRDTEEIVEEEIRNLKRLVDAFTTLGRLPRVDPKPMELSVLMKDLERDPVVSEELSMSGPDTGVLVKADRLLLRRVLVNLVENGRQAGKEAGKQGLVQLSWRVDGGSVVICADDEGPGVPPEKREKIFEPYYTTKDAGSGLGLAISKKIAIDHGGTLFVEESSSELGGARMVLTIPLASDRASG